MTLNITEEHCYADGHFLLTATYGECYIQALYAECHYAECRHADCRGAVFSFG
jgi:hypothetical protein